MKYLLVISIILQFIFSSCTKPESHEMYLNINSTEWYTDTFMINNNTFERIYLKVSGSSNAQLLSIEVSGDGLAGCQEININENNEFNVDVEIRFFPISLDGPHKASTALTAYSSNVQPNIVWCDAIGSGSTIRKELESPFFP